MKFFWKVISVFTEITDNNARHRWLAAIVASVWLYHGLVNKLLGASPRHLWIVQAMPGMAGARGSALLMLVGWGELALAVWALSAWRAKWCAATQTGALLTMNAMELIWARSYLLFPALLVPANLVFLGMAWLAAGVRPAWIRRHPIPMVADFERVLVLTFAVPEEKLARLIPRGLKLDTYKGFGFVAIAMVQTRGLRPAFLPRWFGKDFFLTGYRVFTKFENDGRTRRGLRIVRSDADSRLMVDVGNLLTHYNYQLCRASVREKNGRLEFEIRTSHGKADVRVVAELSNQKEMLPEGSPFENERDARRFAGPLPYTFDYEPETNSIVVIKGVRKQWKPRLVPAKVERAAFLEGFPEARLASAFYLQGVPYRWERGIRFPLAEDKS